MELEHLVRRVPAREPEELCEVAELGARGTGTGARAGDLGRGRASRARGRPRSSRASTCRRRSGRAARRARPPPPRDRLPSAPGRTRTLLERVDGESGRHAPRVRHYAPAMPRGYMEGPAAEEAERRAEEARARRRTSAAPEVHAAVYGCTADDPEPHFLGWLGEVDPDELFASAPAWGVTVRRVAAPLATGSSRRTRRSRAPAASGSSSSRGRRARPRPSRSSPCRAPRRR